LFDLYHYINKLERRIIRLERKLKSEKYKDPKLKSINRSINKSTL